MRRRRRRDGISNDKPGITLCRVRGSVNLQGGRIIRMPRLAVGVTEKDAEYAAIEALRSDGAKAAGVMNLPRQVGGGGSGGGE